MRFLVVFLGLLAVFSMSGIGDADAKRRGGSKSSSSKRIPVIIPIPRGSKDIVFVQKLPKLKVFEHKGKHWDLGYKHGWLWGGEWVGYISHPKPMYIELNQDVAKNKLLPLIGLTSDYVPPKGGKVEDNSPISSQIASTQKSEANKKPSASVPTEDEEEEKKPAAQAQSAAVVAPPPLPKFTRKDLRGSLNSDAPAQPANPAPATEPAGSTSILSSMLGKLPYLILLLAACGGLFVAARHFGGAKEDDPASTLPGMGQTESTRPGPLERLKKSEPKEAAEPASQVNPDRIRAMTRRAA